MKQMAIANRTKNTMKYQTYLGLIMAFFYPLLAHPQERSVDNCASLIQAAEHGLVAKVNALISQGIDIDCRGPLQNTALIAASKANRLEVVKLLCSKHANPNARTQFRDPEEAYSALLWAIENENIAIAELLLVNGADPNLADGWGEIPLTHAVWKKNVPLIELLLRSGADVLYRREVDGRPVLFDAMLKGDLSILESLIKHGADPKLKDSDGWNLIMIASNASYFEGVKFGVARGIGINDRTKSGITAIHLAIMHDSCENLAILEFLIGRGADISVKDDLGTTPLIQASKVGAAKALKILIRSGANVNTQDNNGWTALMFAAKDNQIEILRLLLDGKADLSLKTLAGQTAMSIAKESPLNREAYELLKSRVQK
jgi:uncharacterized protein